MGRFLTILLWSFPLLCWSAGAGALGFDEARHLLVRTGFEASPAQLERLKPLSYERAVALILKETRTEAVTPPPDWAAETQLRPPVPPTPAQRTQAKREQRDRGQELKGWWFRELRATPSPLTERMTLFWHGHFACEMSKVRLPPLMYRQNTLLRREALGNFGTLLHEIARDPAMLLCLEGAGSGKAKPNGLFARALLQRFTLGRGRYTEQDLRDAARAFTGWRVNPQTGSAEFDATQHDDGAKSFLGRRGRLDGDAVIDILLRDPRTAEFIVRKLWREFIDDKPEPAEVQRLAAEFRKKYELKPLVRGLLLTKAFRAPAQRGRMIKSPVELLAGAARQFSIPVGDGREFAQASRGLGQDLFEVPAGGWSSGTAWITADSLAARTQLLARLLRGVEQDERGAAGASDIDDLTPNQLAAVLLAVPPVDPIPAALSSFDLSAHLVRDPAYQLK